MKILLAADKGEQRIFEFLDMADEGDELTGFSEILGKPVKSSVLNKTNRINLRNSKNHYCAHF